jgi:hypothetical protein
VARLVLVIDVSTTPGYTNEPTPKHQPARESEVMLIFDTQCAFGAAQCGGKAAQASEK